MQETVLVRSGWIPRVVRHGEALRLELGAGADANHDPRTFSFPVAEVHLDVMRTDLARHLLLWCAVLPLCDAAGTRGDLDEDAAVALLDPVLLGTPEQVDALFRERRLDTTMLIGHGADVTMLERGQVVESLHSATQEADPQRVQTYVARRGRVRRGVHLAPIDEAILRFTGQYLHGSTLPSRHPDAVDPALLPGVLEVVATAERARGTTRIPRDGASSVEHRHAWRRLEKQVRQAVRRAHPGLADDAVRSVGFLMCSEASRPR